MWYSNPNFDRKIVDVNDYIATLKGDLEDNAETRLALCSFLYRNIGFTVSMLTGISLYPDQIITLKAMLKRNFCLNVWSRGIGKSLLYDFNSQVITKDKGLISITDLLPDIDFRDENYWLNIPETLLWNGRYWQSTDKALVQKGKQTSKLITKLGYSLEGSSVHKIKALDKEKCQIVWKTYDQLIVGDYVCISRDVNIQWGEENDSDESYLVGLLIGDGCLVPHIINITTEDKPILDFCQKYTNKTPYLDKRTEKTFRLSFGDEINKELREKYSLGNHKSYTKQIPNLVLGSKNKLKNFLQGLFDTDGGIEQDGRIISFCSVSEKLSKQVHNALLTFGIISKLRTKKTNSIFGKCFIVQISGENAYRFYKEIGFRLERKQKGMEVFYKELFNTNFDIIPGAKEYAQLIKSAYRLPKELSNEWRGSIRRRNQKHLSYNTLHKYLSFFRKADIKEKDYQNLLEIQKENFFFDEIKEIAHSTGNCIDFNIPEDEMYWSNGFISHNTFISAVYCVLQAIMFPESKILLAGPTFRTSRFIFNHIEKMTQGKKGKMLFDIMGKPSKRPDEFKWQIGSSEIIAIPLNAEKIRGYRANVLFIDEFLLMQEEMVEKVLMPFLVSPQDLAERKRVRSKEDFLIKKGQMKEADRKRFKNKSKFVGLSSASYTCEYLYKKYEDFIKHVYSDKIEDEGDKYFVSQIAWNGVNNYKDRMEESIINAAETEANSANFKREYGAQFVDGSDAYFSMLKMIRQTIKDGDSPTILLRGSKDKKYILSFDASGSNSARGDDFAMCVVELDDDIKGGTVVHSYAEAGKDLKDHIKYFHYLLTSFNIVMVCGDHAGHHQFLDSANESEHFRNSRLQLQLIDFDSTQEGVEFEEEIKKARKLYNPEAQRIVFTVLFRENSIRRMNEHMQGCIDFKRLWFASSIKGDAGAFGRAINSQIDPKVLGYDDMTEMIDDQDILLKQTKYQCAAIEVKTNARGTTTFDLPQAFKRDTSVTRLRKDSYTGILLACWAMRTYHLIMTAPIENIDNTFTPFFVS